MLPSSLGSEQHASRCPLAILSPWNPWLQGGIYTHTGRYAGSKDTVTNSNCNYRMPNRGVRPPQFLHWRGLLPILQSRPCSSGLFLVCSKNLCVPRACFDKCCCTCSLSACLLLAFVFARFSCQPCCCRLSAWFRRMSVGCCAHSPFGNCRHCIQIMCSSAMGDMTSIRTKLRHDPRRLHGLKKESISRVELGAQHALELLDANHIKKPVHVVEELLT